MKCNRLFLWFGIAGFVAEGFEQCLTSRGRRGAVEKREAKTEAVLESSPSDLEDLVEVLALQLDRHDVLELIKQLVSRVQDF